MSIKRISVLNLCHVLKPSVKSTPGKIRSTFLQVVINTYRLVKESFESTQYWKLLPEYYSRRFFAFRRRYHRFRAEVGRWIEVPLDERKCTCMYCSSKLEEFHYLLVCKELFEERKMYIKKSFI